MEPSQKRKLLYISCFKEYICNKKYFRLYRDLEVDESGEVCLVAQELDHHEFVAGLPGQRKQELEHNNSKEADRL